MFQQKKPYSAVTVSIDTLTSESYEEEDLSGIPDLVEVITLQSSGPSEAARAIRKKLKYGNTHRQIRALVILDGLIQNAGPRFQRAFVDEPLLERLRVCGTSDLSDPEVRKKCRELFSSWAQYASKPGLERIARLHRELPKRKVVVKQENSKVLKETENPFGDDDEEDASSPRASAAGPSHSRGPSLTDSFRNQPSPASSSSTSLFGTSSKDKKKSGGSGGGGSSKSKGRRKPFNLEAEKEQMKSVIAESSLAATNLLNVLQTINREKERISHNNLAVERFESCKQLRRRVLRYIHHVDHEQWLGPLLHANDELVHALMTYEQLDQSVDADSDSDDELAEQAHLYRMATDKGKSEKVPGKVSSPTRSEHPDLSGLSLNSPSPRQKKAPPPRPSKSGSLSLSSPPRQIPRQQQQQQQLPVFRPAPVRQVSEPTDEEDDDDPFADKNTVERW
ncbi:Protein lsb5 [Cladobotryum mycophilum]|uniref:Protein lsb5 n=1 Tax=Cladobotryum mycophilum TaxID=491253 RepID=A0ABR0STI2_9HYPO